MNLVDLEQYVGQYVTGCPEPTLVNALRQSVREFSEYTRDYRTTLAVPMIEDQATYDLSTFVPAGTLYDRIERVINGNHHPVRPFRVADFDHKEPGWQTAIGSTAARYTMDNDHGLMRIYPIPDEHVDETLSITVSLKPTLTATTVLDSFANRHAEYLGYGAAGILMKIPGKPWTNPEAGAHFYALFQERMSKTRSRNLRDHTTAAMYMTGTPLDDY